MARPAPILTLALLLGLAGCGQPGDPGETLTAEGLSTTVGESPEGTNATGSGAFAPQPIVAASGLELAGPTTPVSIEGHRTSEFSVARDPANTRRIIAAGMDQDSPDATVACTVFVSHDGGASWTNVTALSGYNPSKEDTDPWVAFDDTGRAYLVCNEGGLMLLSESADGGLTWGDARAVPTGGIPAKGAIGAFGDGELYLCFQQGKLQVMHSFDHGATWTQTGFADTIAGCNGIVRGPGGPDAPVYVMWQGGGAIEADRPQPPPPAVGVLATRDHARSWTRTLIDEDLGTAPANMQAAPQAAAPSIAVSPRTGSVFVGGQRYQNAEVAGPVATDSVAGILLVRSMDGGASFSPLALPEFPSEACSACNQVHPTLTVDDGGRVALQLTLSSSDSLHKEVWLAVSSDDGASWLNPALLSITDLDQSFAAPGNFLPDPSGVVQHAQDLANDPDPSSVQAFATNPTWAVFHRDGGEYFGITSNGDTIVDLWVEHDAEGRNHIQSRLVRILGSQTP